MSEKKDMLFRRKESCHTNRIGVPQCLFFALILVLLSLPLPLTVGAALFYTGGISIDSLSATIDATDQADITAVYELVNHGGNVETATLTFSPPDATARIDGSELSNPVSFDPRERRELTLSYSLNLSDSDCQNILFAPMLFLDDMAIGERVQSYDIRLILPDGVKRITYSSMAYDDTATEDGRLVVLWNKSDIYPSPLSIAWTMLDVDIAATKTVTPGSITTPGEVIEVNVLIENKGEREVGNVTIRDGFHPGTFEAVSPLDDFELIQPEMSDPHLYWTKEIDRLEPSETMSFNYSVRVIALGLETRLDALVVSVDGIPVSVSNDVTLFSELEERYGPAPAEEEFPTIYVIVGVVVVAIIIASAFAVRARRKT